MLTCEVLSFQQEGGGWTPLQPMCEPPPKLAMWVRCRSAITWYSDVVLGSQLGGS